MEAPSIIDNYDFMRDYAVEKISQNCVVTSAVSLVAPGSLSDSHSSCEGMMGSTHVTSGGQTASKILRNGPADCGRNENNVAKLRTLSADSPTGLGTPGSFSLATLKMSLR